MTGRRKKSGASAFDWLRVVQCQCNICIKGHTYVTNLHLYAVNSTATRLPRACAGGYGSGFADPTLATATNRSPDSRHMIA